MRWTTYVSSQDGRQRPGLVEGSRIHGLAAGDRLVDLLAEPAALRDAAARATAEPFEVVELADADVRAPIPVPPSVRDFYAFEGHVVTSARALDQEVNPLWYEIPAFYFQAPQATRGYRDPVERAPGSQRFDYELEVAAVVGRPGRNLSPDEAEDHIAGFMLMCDWSARDVQAREMKLTMGPVKGKDTATSYGPFLVTTDELEPLRGGNAFDLPLSVSVNGQRYSEGNLKDVYWTFGEMLAYASRGVELVPGDIVGSGTVPTGCLLELSLVHGTDRYPFLEPGDVVELSSQMLGSIRSEVRPGAEVIPLRP